MRRNTSSYGQLFRVQGIAGDIVMTCSSEHAKRVFGADPDTFETFAAVVLEPFFGRHSVLLQSGTTHRRLRKLLTPPMHGAQLRGFGLSMQSIAREHIGRLRAGTELRFHDLTTAFTLDVIIRTVFGAKQGTESEELHHTLGAVLEGITPLSLFAPQTRRDWFPPWRRYQAAIARFDALLARIVAERRAQSSPGQDVLSLLLQARYDDGAPMSEPEIRDQLVTLLLAGHETTAVTLAQAIDLIYRHPRVHSTLHEKLAAVGDDPEHIVREPYVSAVLDETLRYAPIVTDVARVVRAPFELEPGLVMPPGSIIAVLIEGIHQDPSLYPNPDEFRPERFLDQKFAPHEFLPFGGGSRRCLGASFSDHEAKIFLATLLGSVDLSLVNAKPSRRVRRNITMGPSDGVPVRVLRKN